MSADPTSGRPAAVAPSPADPGAISAATQGAAIPTTFWGYVKSFGPGIVLVLTWLGAGDLVDNAVAGAHYGYALMWGLALALLVRYFLVSIIANYQLMNVEGHSVFEGYRRVWRYYPWLLGVGGVALGHFYESYTIRGSGEALFHLTGVGSTLIWSVVTVAAAVLITGKAIYRYLENVEKLILAVLAVSLIGGAIMAKPDVGAIVAGTLAFDVPDQVGSFGAVLIVVSLIGAVGGSLANLLYPTFMKEKGYIRPEHRKVQRFDLLFGIVVIIVLDLAVWVMGAEVLHPRGIVISDFNDLAQLLGQVAGRVGEVIIYLGVLCACFSSVIGYAHGFPKMAMDCLYSMSPERGERYRDSPSKDPLFRWAYFLVAILPIVWAIPGMPGFIWLTVFVNAAQIVLMPLVSIGLIVLINRKDLMGERAGNMVHTAVLVFLTLLALWGSYVTFKSMLAG
ncbi:Mn2+/Fe2+ transporter [Allopusillimonas soli]|uniref:Nramp family divalent metal transporter n=1 Tax=Allopusillimonas soli TaxID=659016 RepID=A0A853F651_9BURK|nr:Nramp family divalent metal transporter [Allopusillimonas soli]NYT36035.1 Nramp family divalent metal transporter [Allopusillimonas soli]TEA76376.1 Mn2+/Fe2+ transporter [Allopusillimonas soli]